MRSELVKFTRNEDTELGWLAPDGDFRICEYMEHDQLADIIITERGLGNEYREWLLNQQYPTSRDFLCVEKGFVLINSFYWDAVNVTWSKKMTKAQREFLYAYIGELNKEKAEDFLEGRI